jgi:DNA-directed RNA polymerase specialized sigma24 family protein
MTVPTNLESFAAVAFTLRESQSSRDLPPMQKSDLNGVLSRVAQFALVALIRKGIPVTAAEDAVQTAMQKLFTHAQPEVWEREPVMQSWVNTTAFRTHLTWVRDNPEVLLPGGPVADDAEAPESRGIESEMEGELFDESEPERLDTIRYVQSILSRMTKKCLLASGGCQMAEHCHWDRRCTLLFWFDMEESGYHALSEESGIPISSLHRWRTRCQGQFRQIKLADDAEAEHRRNQR